ncbi:MAG: 50S ribosomal protein L7ae [Candidatus Krumholzibacteriota bacterium]
MTEEATRSQADKLLGLLGLARRAGRLGMGVSAVEKMVHKGENPLVITAVDIGDSLKGRVSRWEPVRGVVADVLTGEDLARALGREKLAVVGVSDSGFVKGIRKLGY